MKNLVLTDDQIEEVLDNSLDHWKFIENKLRASFKLASFHESLLLIAQIGSISEELDHHAEIWNLYDQVTLSVWSHDVSGITGRDLDFAKRATSAYQTIVSRGQVHQSQTETSPA
jgi:4a-hydroxytetrahydrobiopterin dehydratase